MRRKKENAIEEIKTDAEVSEYAKQRIVSLTNNSASFPGLTPTVAELTTLWSDYNEALGQVGSEGTKSATTIKNQKRLLLENGLSTCAQNCSEIAGSNVALYQLSGFGMKNKGVPVTHFSAPENLSFRQGPMDGSVFATFKGIKNAASYEVMVGTTNDPSTWTKTTVNRSSRMLITDLTPLTQYYGCCRAVGARNIKGEWSEMVSFDVV